MLEEFRPDLPEHYGFYYTACWAVLLAAVWASLWWRARCRRRERRTVLADAALSAALVVSLLLAAEGLFFLFFDTTDSFAMSNVARLWFRRHVQTNNRRFRDNVDYNLTPPRGTSRIGFLGDSFTFGHGVRRVEDRFSNRIRRRLEGIAPGRFQVYNLSYPGWDTGEERYLLRMLARQGFRFDLIVLVYVLNDCGDLLPQSGEFHAMLNSLRPEFSLLKNTYLPNFLYYRLRVLTLPATRNYYDWSLTAYQPPHWDKQMQRLRELRSAAARTGAAFGVVTFPYLHNLGPDYPFADVHEQLADFWKNEDVPYLDLLDALRHRSPGELTVNRFDAHPNELAHQLAADTIYKRLLVPQLGLATDDEESDGTGGSSSIEDDQPP